MSIRRSFYLCGRVFVFIFIAVLGFAFALTFVIACAEEPAERAKLPDVLAGCSYRRAGDLSGILLEFEEDGGFTIRTWKSEDRGEIRLNIYNTEFYGSFGPVTKLEGCGIYEAALSSVDRAGGMIYDVYYPADGDIEQFISYLPWEIGTVLRIVPPTESGGICLIGVPSEWGYTYTEYEPRD